MHIENIGARKAVYVELPNNLLDATYNVLKRIGISKLYCHQVLILILLKRKCIRLSCRVYCSNTCFFVFTWEKILTVIDITRFTLAGMCHLVPKFYLFCRQNQWKLRFLEKMLLLPLQLPVESRCASTFQFWKFCFGVVHLVHCTCFLQRFGFKCFLSYVLCFLNYSLLPIFL